MTVLMAAHGEEPGGPRAPIIMMVPRPLVPPCHSATAAGPGPGGVGSGPGPGSAVGSE